MLPVTALAESEKGAYTDISGAWYTDFVAAHGNSPVFSSSDRKFQPNKKITRIEFVRYIHEILEININYFAAPDIRDFFTDMNNDDAGANELIDLVTAGIIDNGGAFEPMKQLDREVMIHWLVKALDFKTGGDYAMIMMMPAPFDDEDKIAAEYRDSITKAQLLRLVVGYGNNRLLPKQGATRAEAVTVTSRLINLLASLKGNEQSLSVTASAAEDSGALVMSLVIHNTSDKAVTITHSGQKYDFKLFGKTGDTVYTWSADKLFIAAMSSTVIEPGQSLTYTETLDKDTWSAVKQDTVLFKAFIIGNSDEFTIASDGYLGEITLAK
jgi:hypothetical protein